VGKKSAAKKKRRALGVTLVKPGTEVSITFGSGQEKLRKMFQGFACETNKNDK
jgi:hypothetical protein